MTVCALPGCDTPARPRGRYCSVEHKQDARRVREGFSARAGASEGFWSKYAQLHRSVGRKWAKHYAGRAA